ncbi:hypothetical protein L7F22_043622 [Adiantum nelumboides]|nr:hypothetical protein [Adiantum nelumboides]
MRLMQSFTGFLILTATWLAGYKAGKHPRIGVHAQVSTLTAGDKAETLCKQLAETFEAPAGLKINNTFSQYFPEGSTLSLEKLTKLYPNGTIPDGVPIDKVLDGVGFDLNIKAQAGYGRLASRISFNGPVGSLPAFCRFGLQISTSPLTSVLTEVWLPVASDLKIPLAIPDPDFPTNTTGYEIGPKGDFITAPLYYREGKYKKVKPSPYAYNPPAPNDVPAPPEDKKNATTTTPSKMMKRDNKSLSGDDILGQGKGWNGRIAVMGHGGQLGFIPMPSMKQYMGRYMFAVAGTNLGHFSVQNGVSSWVNGSQFDQTLLDFGSRANHVTLLIAENAVNQFYGKGQGVRNAKENNRVYRYYLGSSVGGARGLSAAQVYPDDFNGIMVGAPAINFMSLNSAQIHSASVHNKTTPIGKKGFFTRGALRGPIRDVVMRQCDGLDGVEDGVISEPSKCKPELEKELLCGSKTQYGKTNATCLTQDQIKAVYELYKPTIIEGEQIYPAYWPGLEDSASSLAPTNAKGSQWHQLVVLKQPKLDPKFNPFTDIKLADLKKGIAADPGGVNADKTDLSAFIKKGGKLVMYHGSADFVVSPQSTVDYFNAAKKDTAAALKLSEEQVGKSFKFYQIHGMRHSRGGVGSYHFGGVSQNEPGSRPFKFESSYDMTLALIAWVEKGVEINEQIAARYNLQEQFMPPRDVKGGDPDVDLQIKDSQQAYFAGLTFTRLLCPYPAKAIFQKGGNPHGANGYKAFKCVH